MKRAVFLLIVMLSIISLTSCTFLRPDSVKNPKVEITSKSTKIDTISDNMLDSESLQYIMDNANTEELPYISLDSQVEVKFKGTIPDYFEIDDQIITTDGNQEKSTSTTVDYKTVKGSFVLVINPGTFHNKKLNVYPNKKTIRGIELTCYFGVSSYTYAFIVRTDSISDS